LIFVIVGIPVLLSWKKSSFIIDKETNSFELNSKKIYRFSNEKGSLSKIADIGLVRAFFYDKILSVRYVTAIKLVNGDIWIIGDLSRVYAPERDENMKAEVKKIAKLLNRELKIFTPPGQNNQFGINKKVKQMFDSGNQQTNASNESGFSNSN